MADQQRPGADYDSTPPDDAKPRQDPVAGTTGEPAGAGGGQSQGGQSQNVEEGLREQDEAARERAQKRGYQ